MSTSWRQEVDICFSLQVTARFEEPNSGSSFWYELYVENFYASVGSFREGPFTLRTGIWGTVEAYWLLSKPAGWCQDCRDLIDTLLNCCADVLE